jgi:glutamate/tyrosine decarboxylase-like PLP-dependent enzyme
MGGPLLLADDARARLWQEVIAAVEAYTTRVGELRVAPALDRERLRGLLAPFDFARPLDPSEAVRFAVAGLTQDQVHTAHPRYFGLFNPAPTTMGIVADALVAAFNPQLAAWSHNPFGAEVEAHLARAFGARFGYDPAATEGVFASGGAEANHTALLTALCRLSADFGERGVRALPRAPVLYVSEEAHHSFLKAARLSGIGSAAVRAIPVDAELRMDVAALAARVRDDRAASLAPFLVVATAGSTSAGAIDPIAAIAEVAERFGLWLHVDAAWGGAAAFDPDLRSLLAGIERADSITFDAHKWLSVPMAAGLYLTRQRGILERTFGVATGYMPRDAAGLEVIDPFSQSIQWSRRFIGLKVFLSLAVAGWDGYAAEIRRMTVLGRQLRERLAESDWAIVNASPLPLACFVDGRHPLGTTAEHLDGIVRKVVSSGRAWISLARLAGRIPAIRACVTSHRTREDDLDALVESLERARR